MFCSERQAHKALHQRESQFEQQRQEYQDQLEQATRTIQTLRSDFTELQEEKSSHEQTLNEGLQALQHDHDSLKRELEERGRKCFFSENSLSTLFLDRTQDLTLNEREAQYDSQVKQYQDERDQVVQDLEDLRNEFRQMQEEKTAREEELNGNIRSLTAQIETLQTELNERGTPVSQAFSLSVALISPVFVGQQSKLALKEQKDQYEKEIDEYQKNLELALHDNQEYQAAIEKYEDETSHSKQEDLEREIDLLKEEKAQLEAQG